MAKIDLSKIVKDVRPGSFNVGEKVRIYLDHEMESMTLDFREGVVTDPKSKRYRGARKIDALQMKVYKTGKVLGGENLDYSYGPRSKGKDRKLKGKIYLDSFMYNHIVGFERINE